MEPVLVVLASGARWLLVGFVMAGALPLVAAAWQIALVAVHGWRNHYAECRPYFPRVAVLIPAWNEGAVLGASIDRLMRLDYPEDALRIYVVDDASTDQTPEVLAAKSDEYPGRVVHLRREKGGEGKAHTLNHGLAILLADDWMEALLVMDADVIYTPNSLRWMTRHLADPTVGAVTAYIKEGSKPGSTITKFIAFEYITAQAAARRSQNVFGAMACLAGGAQLHSRENLVAIGGRIDTTSLAEDTFTTFLTQLNGRRVVFEPHAEVLAEEPDSINGLWKQRLRWARGNVQLTLRFKNLWFRRSRAHGLGDASFGLFWFCLFLLPLFMIAASIGLVGLYFLDFPLAWTLFHALWITNAVTYVFIGVFALQIDPGTGRSVWLHALMFPGLVSVLIILYTCFPPLFDVGIAGLLRQVGLGTGPVWSAGLTLFIYVWLAASMGAAWLAKWIEPRRWGRPLSVALVWIVGYGPLLCAVTFTAYVKEARRAEMTWDKTEKTGKVALS